MTENITYKLDSFDKLVFALKDVVVEYEGKSAEFIANEINNRLSSWSLSDREARNSANVFEKQSGVRDNIFAIRNLFKALSTPT